MLKNSVYSGTFWKHWELTSASYSHVPEYSKQTGKDDTNTVTKRRDSQPWILRYSVCCFFARKKKGSGTYKI